MTRLETSPRGHWKRRVGTTIAFITMAVGAMVLASLITAQAGSAANGSPSSAARGAPAATASKGDPNPVARDHRGGVANGSVTVTTSKPRPPRGTICAGRACSAGTDERPKQKA